MKRELYKYYSTHRPVGLGTYPKPADNEPVKITNYDVDSRIPVEGGAFDAWGELIYAKPLTDEQQADYELRPSRRNPDVWRAMRAQAQDVGRWEDRNHVPEAKRLTWWDSDFDSYVPYDHVTPEQLAETYRLAMKFPNIPSRAKKQTHPPELNR